MAPPRRDSRLGAREARPDDNGLGRGHVAEIQRARMIAAMVDVVVERGLADTTVAHIVARSGVSRRTFYEIFGDGEDCFLAALDDGIARAMAYVVPAYEEGGGRWRECIRAGLVALLAFLDDEPATGRLMIVESLGAGPRALARRAHVVARLIAAVDEGRAESRARRQLSALTAEGVVGAVLSVIHARLIRTAAGHHGEPERSTLELTGALMGIVVLPYLGHAAAERELARPAPAAPRQARRVSDPLRELDMRLTYRTVKVLTAIGERAGASNREISIAAGVGDQGQISKLLARLARLGLVENAGDGHTHGAPNAWSLTERGWEVRRAIPPQPVYLDGDSV